jgi:hypothetical protein
MPSLLVICLFAVFWIFVLIFIIDRVFSWKDRLRIKKKYNSLAFYLSSFFVLFIISKIFFFYTANLVVDSLDRFSLVASAREVSENDREECNRLLDNIYLSEDTIYKIENHRYIEQLSTDFFVFLEYKKGAERLNIMANKYDELQLNNGLKKYSTAIAIDMRKKAELFAERSALETKIGTTKSKIKKLLVKMDRVTEQRKETIDRVKQQCKIDN